MSDTYVAMTPEELRARSKRVIAEHADEAQEARAAREEQSSAARARARSFQPTPVTRADAPKEATRYDSDAVPGFALVNDAGVYLPESEFSAELPRVSAEYSTVRAALDGPGPRGRLFLFAGPDDACRTAPISHSKGSEKGTGGEGSILPRGMMSGQLSRDVLAHGCEQAILATREARRAHRKIHAGPAIVRRAEPLWVLAIRARGGVYRDHRGELRSLLSRNPMSRGSDVILDARRLKVDTGDGRRRPVPPGRTAAHVPPLRAGGAR